MYIPELMQKAGLRRGLRPKTIRAYNQCLKKFFQKCSKDPKYVKKKDIEDFTDSLIAKGATGSTVNVYYNSLKFFYEQVLHRRLTVNFRFSKVAKRMPTVLSKEEMIRLVGSIRNKKHNLLIQLCYGAGLRVSELVNLEVKDLDLENGIGYVFGGKGGKDRIFVIPEILKDDLAEFVEKNKLDKNSFLFEGRKGHLTTASVREMLKKLREKAGISKRLHPHALRHSFATHIIENGCSREKLQILLGHKNIQTTFTYTHSLPVRIDARSPLDELKLN
jgi:integrase/recombinase XerD